ncbi:MAG: amino acid adenylation domain-containing protein, partial [Clostridia bacterium]|nr:amino acid adenylation domain-containing protein [Clostridia bacterium]
QEELTKKSFIRLLGKPAYRSGDLVRLREDGRIEFHGRIDNQVKLRGLRIELGEIENVINAYPGVRTSIAVVNWEMECIVAYFTAEQSVDPGALKEHMAGYLTAYMMPSAMMQLDEMPLTANGKIDKKALPVLDIEKKERVIDLPENDLQRTLCGIFEKALELDQVGINEDFFELGGTSLKAATVLMSAMQNGLAITYQDIFHTPTVRGLAEILEKAEQETVNLEKRENYPLSKTQMGIFVESMSFEGTTVYNIPMMYKLDERVDMMKLHTALDTVLAAHPYLSMTVSKGENGEVMAHRSDEVLVKVECLDHLPELDELVRPFSLTNGEPLCRAALIDSRDGKYLFLDTHHIVSDGDSLRILFDDLQTAYDGGEIETEQYSGFEFALEEEAARKSERFADAQAWYESRCRGCEGQTLPLREVNLSGDSHIASGRTSGRTSADAVRTYCAEHGMTMNAFFTTAFALALKAYTGSESAVFATIYNGRNNARMMRSISMFVKTLPVVLYLDPEKSVEETIEISKNWLLGAMANDIYSFAEIHEALGIGADVLFAYQGEAGDGEKIGGYPVQEVDISLSQAKSVFGLDISVDGDKVIYDTEYDPARYGAYTMDGFVRMLDRICSEMLIREKIKDICLTQEADEQAIIGLHDTDWPVAERPAYRLVQDSAERWPARTAVVAVDRSLTYAELNAEANAIGHALAERGAKPETIVAVMADRNSWAYVMRQGVLKSGGAFMPIDPEYPDERIRYILENSGAKLLVTTESIAAAHAALLDELGVDVVTAEEAVRTHGRENLNVQVDWESLCYVIYTSGSTGKPKGVMLTNHNLVNFVDDDEKNHEIQGYTKRGHVSLAIAALTFDFAIMEEFVPLANGLTVVLATKEQMMNPAEISGLMLRNHVDVMSCTPSYLSNMLAIDAFVPAVRLLKSVDFGAEAFPAALFGKLKAVNPELYIMNGYGPTEATISCTMEVISKAEDITIGIPNVNVHVATIDRDGRLQPLGAMGEMVILGDGVGRGYVGQEELTKKSFIRLLGKPAYRSGDLVRLREDGRIEFHGRIDNQVKLHGLRIELGEIENVINAYPGVRTSIAVVNWEMECIMAYFTAEKPVELKALKEHMAGYLTAYMMPSAMMQLDEMPLTANGKIDKKALPVLGVKKKERIIDLPENDLQEKLCGIFEKALELEQVGVNENFFDLGGTSLKAATVLMAAMLDGLPITYQDIFNAPTIKALESVIREKEHTEEEKPELEAFSEKSVLSHNRNEYVDEIKAGPLGGVLLTGATGFLGIHVLYDLIVHTDEKVYCLVRPGRMNVRQKLSSILYYYFDQTFAEAMQHRIFIVEGDIEDRESLESTLKYDYHTVINCAACVKHFADIEFLKGVNLYGVQNLTKLCLEKGARLIQISTVSVAGDALGGIQAGQLLREDCLELGQEVQSNAYVYTKYLAEQHVLKAIENDRLDAKIIRVGNLSSRVRDGEFQMNFKTNAFMNTLRAYAVLGCYPDNAMSDMEEVSYIDETARAVVLLSGTDSAFTVFHAYNSHSVEMGDIIHAMNICGVPVKGVTAEEYNTRLHDCLGRDDINSYLSTLVGYDINDGLIREEIQADNHFTTNALYRLGMHWTITDMSVLVKMIDSLKALGFFDCAL